ncbi:methylenetetrahydrofolate reductase [NAD(P)H] [Bordetella bronchiseptica]|uniref:methylenetetrahydrofolate reductase [NAD(P)H] n=1 Tax=Bordetella bronchiseptica TaxID=518 RepID=UPI000461774A|nr:methylenetetrahydrofolate reductase [NAD(P)H] [Bordetella bronchiseptica]KDD21662.1 methylenetetrahydrofolate reductase (NAD(P)H) [Bordetella bronchiseptica MBORD782]VTQ96592.1 5,10-methylenetetrahydrofolate reductase [Bordetella bronchiseptica]
MTQSTAPAFSLEFFPPRDIAAQERLVRAAKQMLAIQPRYVSVTFGAGGSTRAGTADTVRTLRNLGCDAAPHLSCIGATRDQLRDILAAYREQGVRRLVALRGDLPSGMGGDAGELRYASDLVAFIRQETGDWFHIEVAAYPEMHPQAESPSADLAHFVNKVQAGADAAITQYFFNPDAYFDFVERAQAKGVAIPIVPGIMPITNHTQLVRFSEMCGAEIPRWIRLRLAEYGDDKASIRAFGLDVVSELCQTLLENGAPGVHFYTLNHAEATLGIWKGLNA